MQRSLVALTLSLPCLCGLAPNVSASAAPAASDAAYSSHGRRDPFLRPGAPSGGERECPREGLAGLRLDAVALRGVVSTANERIALLVGPDNRSHFARVNDHLCDGRIVALGSDSITFIEVGDLPESTRRQRELRKTLNEP
jgi:Tfp pilus assembly protein PilP